MAHQSDLSPVTTKCINVLVDLLKNSHRHFIGNHQKNVKDNRYDLTCPQYGQILVVQSCIPWNHGVFIAEEAEGVKPIGQCHNDHILIGYQIRARNVFWIAQCEELACKILPYTSILGVYKSVQCDVKTLSHTIHISLTNVSTKVFGIILSNSFSRDKKYPFQ